MGCCPGQGGWSGLPAAGLAAASGGRYRGNVAPSRSHPPQSAIKAPSMLQLRTFGGATLLRGIGSPGRRGGAAPPHRAARDRGRRRPARGEPRQARGAAVARERPGARPPLALAMAVHHPPRPQGRGSLPRHDRAAAQPRPDRERRRGVRGRRGGGEAGPGGGALRRSLPRRIPSRRERPSSSGGSTASARGWRTNYHRVLETLAGQRAAAGDVRGAVDAWRRLAASDPYNARIALGLMRALAASGDAAGAIAHARIHATLLREELGAEVQPEVARYAEELRVAPPAPHAPPASAVAPVQPEPAAVA